MLAYEIPIAWHAGAAFYMNQRTYALLATMSTAEGRPLLSSLPEGAPAMMLAGFPIRILSQLPDVASGAPRSCSAIATATTRWSTAKRRR